ncbi:MAG TPA: sialidase family protein [Vicinamibacterales bacterium]|nr:sialidase family protein [Vicinamibacterales bacterium]
MIRLFAALGLAIATVPIAKQHVPPTLQLTDALVVRRVRDRARRRQRSSSIVDFWRSSESSPAWEGDSAAATAQDRNRLLFVNPASSGRARLTVRLSYDEGTSWPIARVVHAGPAAYSSIVVLPDRSIGVLFERGDRSPYDRISFARFTLDWLTNGSDR